MPSWFRRPRLHVTHPEPPEELLEPALHQTSETRFEEALESTGARDPREFYRRLLRELKGEDESRYNEMVNRYEETVVAPVAEGAVDPLEAWLSFGRELAGGLAPGRLVRVDETGKAEPAPDTLSWKDLLLQIPDDGRTRALPVGIPPEPSSAQKATLALMVKGKKRL